MIRLVLTLALTLGVGWFPSWPFGGQPDFPDKAKARIVISQDRQQMLIYEGQKVVRALPISTGWPGVRKTTTPAWSGTVGAFWGTFQSFGTTQDLGYWLFTDYLSDGSWNGDILVHGAPYTLDAAGQKVYILEQIGMTPASHGCIQLLPEDAEWFHQWDPIGVPITIEPFTEQALHFPKIVFGAEIAGTAPPHGQATPGVEALTTQP